ncbi:aldehyde dehydrogenase family protein [Streptomyces sp. NPDC008313]|uniref:aldehyde dehydrogenase family protein n=1 Tax=Streptomyces sp. NPDC008313 TaxID=3364826 RepID=UPI0036EE5183
MRLSQLNVGDPTDPATVCGPLISAEARDRTLEAVGGARVLSGEAVPEGLGGFYVLPTPVDRVPDGHTLATEEVFGPVAALFSAPDVDTAIARANSVRYGLVASVHTADLDAALQCADRLDTGLVKINPPPPGSTSGPLSPGSRAPDSRFQRTARKALAQWSRIVDHCSHACR